MKKKIIEIKNEHLLIEIKKELLSEIRRYKFISFITLTYPKEYYPKDETIIKEHLKLFTAKMRYEAKIRYDDINKDFKYLYVYKLLDNKIYINIITNIDYKKTYYKLHGYWYTIIGIKDKETVSYTAIVNINKTLDYILKDVVNKEKVERLTSKLGQDSVLTYQKKILSGSLNFKDITDKLVKYAPTAK